MTPQILTLFFCLINLFLISGFKFFKLLLDNPSHGKHKNKLHKGVPLIGGTYFLICSFLIYYNQDDNIISKIYFLSFFLIFVLGAFSDSYKDFSPKIRLILQPV